MSDSGRAIGDERERQYVVHELGSPEWCDAVDKLIVAKDFERAAREADQSIEAADRAVERAGNLASLRTLLDRVSKSHDWVCSKGMLKELLTILIAEMEGKQGTN